MKSRITYIDNLKVLAIFSVIVSHVYWFTWNESTDNVWCHLINVYFMPLFFFMSGAFAKGNMNLKHVWRKVKQLLLPFLIVGGLYTITNGQWHKFLFDGAHNGYWFLPTLLVLFLTFYVRCLISQCLHIQNGIRKVVLDVAYMIMVWGLIKVVLGRILPEIASLLCLDKTNMYIPYFYGGYIIFCNKSWFKALLEKKIQAIYAFVLVAFIVLFYVMYYSSISIPDTAHQILSFLAIFILFVLFRNNKVRNEKIQNALSYVGQHTLEIYVLQYFFLPQSYTQPEAIMGG